MSHITPAIIDDVTLQALKPPRHLYYLVLLFLSGGIATFFAVWIYQTRMGMGVAGITHPVAWATYIGNFVFWIGIAHSGTLISAILHLLRARWRAAISRSAEAMTIFAVAVAGLFPMVHLGRVWIFYYILPYPSQRDIWPNFISPLVWDVCAVFTYFTVSTVFFYVGLIPDLAAARDRLAVKERSWRFYLYRALALGWIGSGNQWRTRGRAFLFFAALATPLVVSVHSIVSWDFAMSLLPGWHTTIYAPYFVAGAIHSGLAMVLTLLIPMRRLLKMERLITPHHFQMIALTMLVTASIIGYTYVVEPFTAWYSGAVFDRQFIEWRAVGWFAWAYWLLPVLNVLVPATFAFRRVRERVGLLFIGSLLVNCGMWLERLHIVAAATAFGYMPHAWGQYAPTWVEILITAGSFALFFFLFIAFTRLLPPVSLNAMKEDLIRDDEFPPKRKFTRRPCKARGYPHGAAFVFEKPEGLVTAVNNLNQTQFDRFEYFSPTRIPELERMTRRESSPVRWWTLIGAIAGLIGGFWLAIGTAQVNELIVGGKTPVSLVPYCIVGFEGLILIGSLANLAGMLFHAKLYPQNPPGWYNRRFSQDRYGLFVVVPYHCFEELRIRIAPASPTDARYVA